MQPNLLQALEGWFEPTSFGIVTDDIDSDGHTIKSEVLINTDAMVQQYTTKQLMILPEGQRAYQWWLVHTRDSLGITTNDNFILSGVKYKVKQARDNSRNGFFKYHVIEERE